MRILSELVKNLNGKVYGHPLHICGYQIPYLDIQKMPISTQLKWTFDQLLSSGKYKVKKTQTNKKTTITHTTVRANYNDQNLEKVNMQ